MRARADVILPCYNPNDSWHKELLGFHTACAAEFDISYVVVNDGSPIERLRQQIDELTSRNINVRLISYPRNRGKGYALRKGVKESDAPFIFYTDLDFPFTNESGNSVLAAITSGTYDIVAGYRDATYYNSRISPFRKTLSRGFRWFVTNMLKMPLSDTQCGIKAFNAAGRELFLSTTIDRYLFDFEFIYKAVRQKGTRVGTVQVTLKENVVFSKMRLRILAQESLNLFKVLLSRGR